MTTALIVIAWIVGGLIGMLLLFTVFVELLTIFLGVPHEYKGFPKNDEKHLCIVLIGTKAALARYAKLAEEAIADGVWLVPFEFDHTKFGTGWFGRWRGGRALKKALWLLRSAETGYVFVDAPEEPSMDIMLVYKLVHRLAITAAPKRLWETVKCDSYYDGVCWYEKLDTVEDLRRAYADADAINQRTGYKASVLAHSM